ncbi:MAG: hypothetical protein IKJ00_02915, partial [Clostridia bacterium]|nr:hypothetical protein [Clostridia bacterium]
MLFTMIPLSVSAGETTGTILDIAQNDGNGNYYLTGPVTVTATYADEFTGTFDGRGFTVTTSVPLFKSVNNATIENLTVAEGTITGMSSIANYISGNATFKQITNNATINGSTLSLTADYDSAITSTDSVTGGIAGLIIGSSDDGTVVNFENCVNNGEVTTIETTGNASTGGILGAAMFLNNLSNTGYANKVEINFVNCTNVGKIEAKNNAGGILGVTYGGVASLSVTECQNKGNVIAGGHAGGITGMTDPTVEPAYFTNCGSNGTITSNDIAGGIVGRAKAKIKIEYCTNELNAEETNTVTAKAHGGGILGYADSSYETTIENCTNKVPVSYNNADNKTHIGGIVGYGNSPLALLNCYNSGNVTSSDIAGGIVGRVAAKTAITYCGNTADVVATSSTSGWAYYGGGILGYEGGKEVDISYCYNTGNIKFNLYGGGIAGRIHNTLSDIIGCYNSGTVELWNTSVNNPKLGQIAHIGNHGTLANNYYDATKILTPYNDTAVKATPYNTDGTTDDLTSGALALAMNKSIGKTVYYQNVNAGTTTDAHPVLDSTHGHVFNTGNSQYSSLRFHTLETASVRLNEDGVSGLRFST